MYNPELAVGCLVKHIGIDTRYTGRVGIVRDLRGYWPPPFSQRDIVVEFPGLDGCGAGLNVITSTSTTVEAITLEEFCMRLLKETP